MHNPLRSEAEMFRVVVIVGIALLPVFVLGLAAGPGWAAGLLVIEIAVATYWIWRSSRGIGAPHGRCRRTPTTTCTGSSWSPTRRSPAGPS